MLQRFCKPTLTVEDYDQGPLIDMRAQKLILVELSRDPISKATSSIAATNSSGRFRRLRLSLSLRFASRFMSL